MNRNVRLKWVIACVFALFVLLCIALPVIVHAGTIDSSIHNIINSKGKTVGTITMQDGAITIVIDSHTASNKIKWETVGLTITRIPLAEKTYDYVASEGTYHLHGYKDVNTVYDYGYAELPFNEAVSKSSVEDKIRGITTTTIKFSVEQVEDALGADFEDIVKGTPIYLHGIFSVYEEDSQGNHIPHNNQGHLVNWFDILTAEWWDRSDNQLEDFAPYYNMQIDFQPARQTSTLSYYTVDGIKMGEKPLTSVFPGEKVSWNNEPTTKQYNNISFELIGYRINVKGSSNIVQSLYIDSGGDINKIKSGEVVVRLGGMEVKLIYRELKTATIVINAVDQDKATGVNFLSDLYTSSVTASQNFSRSINSQIQVSGVSYKKTLRFSYRYTKTGKSSEEPAVLLSTQNETDPIAFKIPVDIKNGSTVYVDVYYEIVVPGSIPITVKAINKDTGAVIQTLTNGTVNSSSLYEYTIPSPPSGYDYSGEWDWSYVMTASPNSTVLSNGSGAKVSFTAPSADKLTAAGITVRVYYSEKNTEASTITLRTIMVSGTGGIIDEISTETVTRGQAITKIAASQRSVNEMPYNYLSRWDYDYITSTGSTTKNGTGANISFTIPTTTTLGTTVTLRLYYDATPIVTVPPASGPITKELDSPIDPTGVINGDKYTAPYFTSKLGIPTTESQYVYVKTKDYLLGYTLVNRTGKIIITVPVTMNYTLQYYTDTPAAYGGPKLVTDTETDTQYADVEKAYSYWEIVDFELYYVGQANVYNYSLPGGSVLLNANNSYLDIPSLSTIHSDKLMDHIILPDQAESGIVLNAEKPITSSTSDRPVIEYEDLKSYAITMTDELMVKNDYLMFDGSVVLNNTPTEKIAPLPNTASLVQSNTIIPDKTLYTEGKVIDATKENGVFSSSGVVTYFLNPQSVNAPYSNKTFSINVNNVTIHTPVICNPILSSDNDKWVQLINPINGTVQIVLDPDTTLNDFTLSISNTLQHSSRLGYYTRDFSKSFIDPANISYIAKQNGEVRNEVRFPFDVYIDILNDSNAANDKYIKAGTWFVLGRNTYRFYVPMWVQEGTYDAELRTVAVNGTNKLTKTERTRNASIINYVATSLITFQVSGRVYGLTMYDISDYPKWENVFRVEDTMLFKLFEGNIDGTKRTNYNKDYSYYYTVGTNNQYGSPTRRYSKYTAPLIAGSHPEYSNLGVLKTGYAVRFMLDTTGDMYSSACHIKITPTFYYVDADGKNRRQVDLYYDEEIDGTKYQLVKVGEGIDLVNIQSGLTGNIYSRIPEKEIENTAAVFNTTYTKVANQKSTMYSYSVIKLLNAFRTFIGWDYATNISKLSSFTDVSTATGLTQLSLSKYKQRWYGTYKIPANVHAVAAGYDVYDYMKKNGVDYSESFWLTGGYIIVNFNIVTVDKNGNERLSYINGNNYLYNGNCSMWVTEGAPIQKTDSNGAVFNLKAGDFIVYDTDKSYNQDYEGNLY